MVGQPERELIGLEGAAGQAAGAAGDEELDVGGEGGRPHQLGEGAAEGMPEHVHLEGTLDAGVLQELDPGPHPPPEFSDFAGFLQCFKHAVGFLRTPDDYALVTRRLIEKLARQNVQYAEITLAAGVVLALLLGPALNAITLGDDAARALGTRLNLVRFGALGAITLMSGSAVAVAGPITFVGLVVPHLARAICGADQRWLMAYAAILGPCVILIGDIIGRVVLPPGEVQVGIIMAIVGAPLFIAIVRGMRMA